MSHNKEQDSIEEKNRLNLNEHTYAIGNAAEKGFIATAIAASSFLLLTTVGEKVPIIKPVAKFISDNIKKIHDAEIGKTILDFISAKTDTNVKENLAEKAGIALAVGFIVGHIAQGAGFLKGKITVKEAVHQHDETISHNIQLKNENDQLKEAIILAAHNPEALENNPVMQQLINKIIDGKPASHQEAVQSTDTAMVNSR